MSTLNVSHLEEINFEGVFDGNGHIIRNLSYVIVEDERNYIGLFGYIEYAEIKNVGLENVTISSPSDYIGTIVGCQSMHLEANCRNNQ